MRTDARIRVSIPSSTYHGARGGKQARVLAAEVLVLAELLIEQRLRELELLAQDLPLRRRRRVLLLLLVLLCTRACVCARAFIPRGRCGRLIR